MPKGSGENSEFGQRLPLVPTKISSTSVIRYPSAPYIGDTTDYVGFQFYDYKPPFQAVDRFKGTGGGIGVGAVYGQYNASVQVGDKNLKPAKGFSPMFLYMPQDIQGQYGANWGGASFGANFKNLAELAGRGGIPNLNSFANTISGLVGSFKHATYKTAVDAMNKNLGTSVSLKQLMGGVSGTIMNPNVEMMYESPELRGFQLRFKMQARNQGESVNIKKICYQFKRALHAGFGGSVAFTATHAGSMITVPKICQVSFMTGGDLNVYVPQYKPCAITQVDINYTPDGAWASLDNGAPVATEIAVTFKETKLIYAQEINLQGASY